MTPYFEQDGITLYHGDCREVLQALPDESVHAVVTDPPYGLSFMGKRWDYDVPSVEVWQQCLRVLKPGGHLLAFAGTRTQHRMAVRIEDAGFEIRDMIAWVYGSGFPKSLDVSKAIDKLNGRRFEDRFALGRHIRERREACGYSRAEVNAWFGYSSGCEHWEQQNTHGARVPTLKDWKVLKAKLALVDDWDSLVYRVEAERAVVGRSENGIAGGTGKHAGQDAAYGFAGEYNITAPATEDAKRWQGWGTALKPALEPITVARKPLCGTVAENVLTHGCGGLNVDGCRVGTEGGTTKGSKPQGDGKGIYGAGLHGACEIKQLDAGRWPANLIHDGSDEVTGMFPDAGGGFGKRGGRDDATVGEYGHGATMQVVGHGDSGSAARFFYTAKADKADRGHGNKHPTVKPVDLMRYLVRLVCPMDGLILDPFAGSGTTLVAAQAEHCRAIGVEREEQYCEFIRDERFRQRVLF